MKSKLYNAISMLFPAFELILPNQTINTILSMQEDELFQLHFGFGIYLRNIFLTKGCKLYELFISSGINNKDDMSSLIIELFYKYLTEKTSRNDT